MEKEGEITLLRGGGACLKRGSYEVPVISKFSKNVEEKERIAKYAADLVKDGESIYIDSGSTALMMIKYLREKNITVVTTNAMIYQELQTNNIILNRLGLMVTMKNIILIKHLLECPVSQKGQDSTHLIYLKLKRSV